MVLYNGARWRERAWERKRARGRKREILRQTDRQIDRHINDWQNIENKPQHQKEETGRSLDLFTLKRKLISQNDTRITPATLPNRKHDSFFTLTLTLYFEFSKLGLNGLFLNSTQIRHYNVVVFDKVVWNQLRSHHILKHNEDSEIRESPSDK